MSKIEVSIWGWRCNWLVVVMLIVLATLLGVANNFRVYEEQRVPWTGPELEQDIGSGTEVEQ